MALQFYKRDTDCLCICTTKCKPQGQLGQSEVYYSGTSTKINSFKVKVFKQTGRVNTLPIEVSMNNFSIYSGSFSSIMKAKATDLWSIFANLLGRC